jgi:S-adenosylmethionine-diacylgycerolhomoserine-N-methlytransferase
MSGSGADAMDRMYRTQRHIYDLSRKFYLLGRDGLIEDLAPAEGARVLEIGCGTGRNLIKAARKYPKADFFGFDISNEMLSTARHSILRAGLANTIKLAQADAANFDPEALFGVKTFDRIYISYAVSMIPPWREALAEATRYLGGKGSLHILDFGDQAGLPAWFRTALERWLTLFSVHPRLDLEAVLIELAQAKNLRLDFIRPFRGYAFYAKLQA